MNEVICTIVFAIMLISFIVAFICTIRQILKYWV